jgi:hypothetical protein
MGRNIRYSVYYSGGLASRTIARDPFSILGKEVTLSVGTLKGLSCVCAWRDYLANFLLNSGLLGLFVGSAIIRYQF